MTLRILCTVAVLSQIAAFAGDETPNGDNELPAGGLPPGWALELGGGVSWSNVRDQSIPGYTLIPAELTLSYCFRASCLSGLWGGIFEGQPEVLLRGLGTYVLHGVESRIVGFAFGGRYNFTHFSSRWVPFAEANFGAAWADSNPTFIDDTQHGLGQDFNFCFSGRIGVSYAFTERLYSRLSCVYTHYSNAGLSEPEFKNRAIDSLGPMLAFGYRF